MALRRAATVPTLPRWQSATAGTIPRSDRHTLSKNDL